MNTTDQNKIIPVSYHGKATHMPLQKIYIPRLSHKSVPVEYNNKKRIFVSSDNDFQFEYIDRKPGYDSALFSSDAGQLSVTSEWWTETEKTGGLTRSIKIVGLATTDSKPTYESLPAFEKCLQNLFHVLCLSPMMRSDNSLALKAHHISYTLQDPQSLIRDPSLTEPIHFETGEQS